MKIGIFDSGIGGLIVARSLIEALPAYDYLYLGDTARVPYGNRSQETIYQFSREAVEYLFAHDCGLIIIACNTASAEALRRIQQEYLPAQYPNRKVLGVLIPAAEAAVQATRNQQIGIIATASTVNSGAFEREILKLLPSAKVHQVAAPLLVPMIENNSVDLLDTTLPQYLKPLISQGIDTLILGCTHYPAIKDQIRSQLPSSIQIISQDEILPGKLSEYVQRHPEVSNKLTQQQYREFLVTDLTQHLPALSAQLFGQPINFKLVHIDQT